MHARREETREVSKQARTGGRLGAARLAPALIPCSRLQPMPPTFSPRSRRPSLRAPGIFEGRAGGAQLSLDLARDVTVLREQQSTKDAAALAVELARHRARHAQRNERHDAVLVRCRRLPSEGARRAREQLDVA